MGYNPRTVAIAPYSSTEVVTTLAQGKKTQLLFFRCDVLSPRLFLSYCLCSVECFVSRRSDTLIAA